MENITTEEYVLLLEKVNQQLNLLSNPYGVMVMVLTLLVAILAIITTFIIYRQGVDYKNTLKKSLESHQEILEKKLIEIGNEAEQTLQSYIDQKNEEISGLAGEAKEEVTKAISKVEAEKNSITSRIKFNSIDHFNSVDNRLSAHNSLLLQNNTNALRTCSSCYRSLGVTDSLITGRCSDCASQKIFQI